MATYIELRKAFGNNRLKNLTESACIVAAMAIVAEDAGAPNHDNRLAWARRAFTNTTAVAEPVLKAMLAANKDLEIGDENTPGTILGATDAQVQPKVDAVIDLFATEG